ncbi:MAG TPA: Fur family transcriptional regulator [Candidatus Polarisedimenticolia bacterium]|nr:Fur family transcriptional regulator [Candidatus Polarisedimenticolia bacterium]
MARVRAAAVMARLGDAGRKPTPARARVVTATLKRQSPFTAQEVVREVARSGIGRATVFRTLDLLVSIGALSRVHGVDDGGRCVRYTPCAPEHHHHLVCRSCGRVEEIDLAGLDTKLAGLARASGYAVLGHTLEVAGICANCREPRP